MGFQKTSEYHFLGYSLNLKSGILADDVFQDWRQLEFDAQVLTVLFSHYLQCKPSPISSILIKFTKLPGGYAYEKAFLLRAAQPIAQAFGPKPSDLLEAGKLLGGTALAFGDSSIQIPTLEGIPVVYVVWAGNEFPASATVLFDQSASSYLPTEDLAVLAELTSSRLIRAKNTQKL